MDPGTTGLGKDVHYTYTPDHVVLRLHRIGLRITRTDLESVYAGTLATADLPMELLVQHVHGPYVS